MIRQLFLDRVSHSTLERDTAIRRKAKNTQKEKSKGDDYDE